MSKNPLVEQGWIHELANAEINPLLDPLQDPRYADTDRMIEESTIGFLTSMREYFLEYVRIFNSYSDSGKSFSEIKIYSVAQTSADFMIFRNQVKLLVANSGMGLIEMSYPKIGAGGTSATPEEEKTIELSAQVGPFGEVVWTYKGEKILPEQVVKYVFQEFVRQTRDRNGKKLSNQVLLEQIKTLLEQKGINL